MIEKLISNIKKLTFQLIEKAIKVLQTEILKYSLIYGLIKIGDYLQRFQLERNVFAFRTSLSAILKNKANVKNRQKTADDLIETYVINGILQLSKVRKLYIIILHSSFYHHISYNY